MNGFEFPGYKHYITIDEKGCIVSGWSDAIFPEKDKSNAICINENGSYQFYLTDIKDPNPSLNNMDDIPLYKWDDGSVLKRTDSEIEADRAERIANQSAPESTEMEKMRADLDYVMLMNGLDVDPN